MKIYVDYIYSISDYRDESKWVDYGLLIHLFQIFDIRKFRTRYLYS
jgi:hypothetical protein